jgi:hypothetical protein
MAKAESENKLVGGRWTLEQSQETFSTILCLHQVRKLSVRDKIGKILNTELGLDLISENGQQNEMAYLGFHKNGGVSPPYDPDSTLKRALVNFRGYILLAILKPTFICDQLPSYRLRVLYPFAKLSIWTSRMVHDFVSTWLAEDIRRPHFLTDLTSATLRAEGI